MKSIPHCCGVLDQRQIYDEVEDASFYNTICSENNNKSAEEASLDNDGYDMSLTNRHDKFKMVRKRWEG